MLLCSLHSYACCAAQGRKIKELEASGSRTEGGARELRRAQQELAAAQTKNHELQRECARLLDMLEPLLSLHTQRR
jgi:hypothetical protein